jgi:hypothetical protein
MKTRIHIPLAVLLSLLTGIVAAAPLGTAFTYQGLLHDGGAPAQGIYDLRFTIYDALAGGGAVAGPLTNTAVAVTNGLFAAVLDFGSGVFTGDACWLEIAVRTNGSSTFIPLTPRQPLTPAPYALFAPNAGAATTAGSAASVTANGVANASLQANAVTSDKIADGAIAAFDLSPVLASNTFWRLGGNTGTTPGAQFLGTTDNQPMELWAGARRVLRLAPDPINDAPNVIAGSSSNNFAPGVVGAVIAGGGRAADPNGVFGDWGVVGGGQGNVVSNHYDVVSGGVGNTAGGGWSTVGGGFGNVAYDLPVGRATVAGGMDNRAVGSAATVGGGWGNAATESYATVPGGQNNTAGGTHSLAAGRRAKALHDGTFVWADSTEADFASTGTNQFLIRATGGVGIGTSQPQSALHVAGTVTASGFSGSGATLTGFNASQLSSGTVPEARLSANVSRLGSTIESPEIADGTIAAADVNAASFNGTFWRAAGNAGTTPGTHFLGTTYNQPLEFKVNGQRGLRLEPGGSFAPNVIGGTWANTVTAGVLGATIAGGGYIEPTGTNAPNTIAASYSTIGGGAGNTIQADAYYSTIGGGAGHTIQPDVQFATIGGGRDNAIQPYAHYATIAGGVGNMVQFNALEATIAGGMNNTIQSNAFQATLGGGYVNTIQTDAYFATLGGGFQNTIQANAECATIPGGRHNSATNFAFAAGRRAKANHTGAFVWADSADADFASTTANQFNIRATGGVRVDTGTAPGIALSAADRALLTCGWNPFTSGAHSGVGRWGMFMEAHTLTLGMPAVGGKTVQVVKYNEDSTSTPLLTVDQGGTVTATAFNPPSDRNAKENFAAVSPQAVLENVISLPITRWNFKQDADVEHLGPMAQDFHAAFGLGTDDKHIATVDADGVALAAIQGLNQKVEAQRAELEQKQREITELGLRLERLESLLLRPIGDCPQTTDHNR